MSMNGAPFKPVYGTAEQIAAAKKEPGKIYFSIDGGVQVATGGGTGTQSLKTISYPVQKIDKLLDEKASIDDLRSQVEESIAEQMGASKEEFEELKKLLESLQGEDGDALKKMTGDIQKNTSDIKELTSSVDTLKANVESKADQSELESLSGTVTEQGSTLTGVQGQISDITSQIATKAESSAVESVGSRVDTVEQTLSKKANTSDLDDYLREDELDAKLGGYVKSDELNGEIESVLDEKDYMDEATADERYVKTSDAETQFLHATETRSEDIIDSALESLKKIKATVELEHGMDITLAEDTDTVTIKGQHDSKVEIGGVGNIRVIPSTAGDALNEDGEFTSAFAIVDPSTDKAVNAIGFVGKPKIETIASRKKRAIATLAAGGVVDDSTVSIKYLYLGFNPETKEPLVKITTDGKVYIGNDETDIVSRLAALEARIAELEGGHSPDLDVADDQAVSDGLGEIFQG